MRQGSADHPGWNLLCSPGVELVALLKLALLPGHAGLDLCHHQKPGLGDKHLKPASRFVGKPEHTLYVPISVISRRAFPEAWSASGSKFRPAAAKSPPTQPEDSVRP